LLYEEIERVGLGIDRIWRHAIELRELETDQVIRSPSAEPRTEFITPRYRLAPAMNLTRLEAACSLLAGRVVVFA
jgi:hypothetical protein